MQRPDAPGGLALADTGAAAPDAGDQSAEVRFCGRELVRETRRDGRLELEEEGNGGVVVHGRTESTAHAGGPLEVD